jgi:hypothetical protein
LKKLSPCLRVVLDLFDLASTLARMAEPLEPPTPLPPGLSEASPQELTDALSYALRYDERGKRRRSGGEMVASLAAEHPTEHLQRAGFVLLRRRPGRPHSAG